MPLRDLAHSAHAGNPDEHAVTDGDVNTRTNVDGDANPDEYASGHGDTHSYPDGDEHAKTIDPDTDAHGDDATTDGRA